MGGGCGLKSPTNNIFSLFLKFSFGVLFSFTHLFWVFLVLTFFFSFFTYTNFNKNIMSLPFVSSNRDIIVNLYKLHFFYSLIFLLNQIKEFYILLFFHPHPNTLRKTKISYISLLFNYLPIFYHTTFPPQLIGPLTLLKHVLKKKCCFRQVYIWVKLF